MHLAAAIHTCIRLNRSVPQHSTVSTAALLISRMGFSQPQTSILTPDPLIPLVGVVRTEVYNVVQRGRRKCQSSNSNYISV